MNKKIIIAFITSLIMSSYSLHSAVINSTENGGNWADESTWVGGKVPSAEDDVVINGLVITNGGSYSTKTYRANKLTIAEGGKILREGEGSGGYTILEVNGNLINNGELIDLANWLDLRVSGNLTNNGVFKPRTVNMIGTNVTLNTQKPIECEALNINVEDDYVTPETDLKIRNCYVKSSKDQYIKMGSHKLYLESDTIKYDGYYGKFTSNSRMTIDLTFDDKGVMNLENSIYRGTVSGDVTITSNEYAFLESSDFEDDLNIAEGTRLSAQENLITVRVMGDFYNNGVMNYDSVRTDGTVAPARSTKLYVYGDYNNSSITGRTDFYIVTDGGTNNIYGNIDGYVKIMDTEDSEHKDGQILIDSKVEIGGRLDVYTDMLIDTSGHLKLTYDGGSQFYKNSSSEVENNGTFDRVHRVNNNWNYRHFDDEPGTYIDYELRDWEGELNSVYVTTYNNQTHPALAGTSNRWWRVESDDNFTDLQYTLKLYYDESQLNGQSEDEINVFRSNDKGKTWEVVSIREYVEHNKEENYFSIGTWSNKESLLTEFGDFVIGTGDATVPVESPLVMNLTGREDVRLGAPNPFTVTIDNITNKRTEDYILPIDVGDEIEFMYFEFTHNNGVERVPFDSMGLKSDNTALLFIPALEPNETISFDFVVKGIESKESGKVLDSKSILVGAVGDKAQDGIVGALVGYVNSVFSLSDKERSEYARGLNLTVQQTRHEKKTYGRGVTALRTVLKKGVEKASESNPATSLVYKVGSAIETVSEVAPTLRQRLFYWFYKETGLYGVEESKVAGGTSQDVRMVKSWDPNEKTGPSGYGEDNYLKDAGTFTYNISFENKKEATAPAYKIEILDTLSNLFDPETVEFRSTSHSESNDWTVEREGNILRWYVEGIELPPNANPPEGEGYVSFSVKLNDGVESGEIIENRATIVFDENAPITTNTWVNVLDGISPNTTEITAAYDKQNEVINLELDVEDNEGGSGIGEIAYFVSVDGKPFRILGYGFEKAISFNTSSDSGSVYRFYAVTSDNVGNQESAVPEVVELDITGPSKVEENRLQIPISVYPNPVQNYVNIDLLNAEGIYSYELYELSGRPIKNGEIIGQSSIGISDLTSGVYLLKITKDNKFKVFKLVKED
ncbi:MAG: T9SS type A sorting domain-containing protein [Chlorobiota bacterium]